MTDARTLVIGSRGSPLALAQAQEVIATLAAAHPRLACRVQTIHSVADRHPDVELARLPGVGVFTRELELALLAGQVDAAVHSLKDLPARATAGLRLAAVTRREDPRDAIVAAGGRTLATLPAGARIGTSSPRRAAALRALRPDLQVVPVRGNVQTRIRKVDAGELDAVCLAAAGLRRIGLDGRITDWLPLEVALPAPGQGALGVQVRDGDEATAALVAAADHLPTRYAVEAERALLRALEAGCRLPVGAYAELRRQTLVLRASVGFPDGRIISGERQGPVEDREALGIDLARGLLAAGAQAAQPAALPIDAP